MVFMRLQRTLIGWRGDEQQGIRASFCVRRPQQVCRAETMVCAVASHLAPLGDEFILNYQGVVKATPMPRKGMLKDQDYHDTGYNKVTHLAVRSTPGHREPHQGTTY